MSRKRWRRGRANAKGRTEYGEGFTSLPHTLTESEAFRTLPGSALKIYIELRRRFRGGNNGNLHVSLEEAKRLLRMGKATALRGFRELESRGLIVKTRAGNWYRRLAARWRLTDKSYPIGTPPTNEWRQWQNPQGIKNRTAVPDWNEDGSGMER